MATKRWVGKAKKVAQVMTFTPANVLVGNTFTIGIPDTTNGKTVTFTATAATVANVTAGLVAALQAFANDNPEFAEITWADASTAITATAVTAGIPFTAASTASGGTATLTAATTIANSSPNDADIAQNWSDNTLPGLNDTLIFDEGSIDCSWNVNAFSAATGVTIYRRIGYTGKIGLPNYNAGGYFEYRATEFLLTGATLYIETQSSDAPAQFKFNTQGTAATVTIIGDGPPGLGSEVVWWRGTSAGSTLRVEGSSCAVAIAAANAAANVATVYAQQSSVRFGTGVVFATSITSHNAELEVRSNLPATVTQTGDSAVLWVRESATGSSPKVQDGAMFWMSDGTLTTPTIGTDATIDFSRDNRARTISGTVQLYKNATWNDPASTALATFKLNQCTPQEVNIFVGPDKTLAFS